MPDDNRVYHNDHEICEWPAESFLSRLSYVSGQMQITIDPEEACLLMVLMSQNVQAGLLINSMSYLSHDYYSLYKILAFITNIIIR